MGIKFDREAWYTEEQVRIAGIDGDGLRRAARKGEVRKKKVGRQHWYKGEWLLEWLDRAEEAAAK